MIIYIFTRFNVYHCFSFLFFFFFELGFELRTSHSTAWAMPLVHFALVILEIGVSWTICPGLASNLAPLISASQIVGLEAWATSDCLISFLYCFDGALLFWQIHATIPISIHLFCFVLFWDSLLLYSSGWLGDSMALPHKYLGLQAWTTMPNFYHYFLYSLPLTWYL
jgi:hypothetical protein